MHRSWSSARSYATGDVVRYGCKEVNYVMQPGGLTYHKLKCLSSGQWEALGVTCQPLAGN